MQSSAPCLACCASKPTPTPQHSRAYTEESQQPCGQVGGQQHPNSRSTQAQSTWTVRVTGIRTPTCDPLPTPVSALLLCYASYSYVCSSVHAPEGELRGYKQHPAPPTGQRHDQRMGGGGKKMPKSKTNTRCCAHCFAHACLAPNTNPAVVPTCNAPCVHPNGKGG